MRIVPLLLGLVCCASWVVAAPVPKPKEGKDQEKLLGRWQVVGRESSGSPRSGVEDCFWVFETGKMTIFSGKTDKGGAAFTLKLDTESSPRHLEITLAMANGNRYQGLYELNGDELKWAHTGANGQRPDEIKATGDTSIIYFKRVKE